MQRAILKEKWAWVCFAAGLAALPALATPLPGTTVIYSNLGPGNSFQTGFGDNWLIGGTGAKEVIAQQFITSTAIQFADAQLALDAPGFYTSINVYLESGPDLPGYNPEPATTILDTLVQQSAMTDPPSLITFKCSSCALLLPGTTYWIVAAPIASPYIADWQTNNTGVEGLRFDLGGSTTGPWTDSPFQTSAAFEVDGVAMSTPEPGPAALLITGTAALLLLVRFGRRRRDRNRCNSK